MRARNCQSPFLNSFRNGRNGKPVTGRQTQWWRDSAHRFLPFLGIPEVSSGTC